ncbi:unnamed protein product [Acanthoscelides obtectus]|nr:unnamed protein product [Acanthoscelides obtectus]CAH1955442.1 unnamed protein product [Acanthoscelides obtectus]CAK1672831.1 hypothetical protein AOBTE_LOCUS29109 [Acanthoscelides obtectus]CAK1672832.1 hypothetical protein AOBTE_LOCUS29109 [Acanthoscelides obtectus]
MAKLCTDSVVRSSVLEGVIPMNKGDDIVGGVDIFLRMTCYADGLETAYRKNKNGTFDFINKKNGATYNCKSELSSKGDPLMCANLHGSMVCPIGGKKDLSWTDLFGGTAVCVRPSMVGTLMEEETLSGGGNLVEILAQSSAFDIVSMVFRPPENKFFDFFNMVSVPSGQDDKGRKINSEIELSSTKYREEDDRLLLTSEKIGRQLCKNKDCPAAVKFKEYGIGPLANEKCLGTLYGEVDPPCTYGLSNTYGVMENYGPFGVYSRPKRPDQPFIPKQPPEADPVPPMEAEVYLPLKKPCPGAPKPPCTPKLCCACYRQKNGGGLKRGSPHQELNTVGGCRGMLKGGNNADATPVLRLRGGGSGEFADPPLAESTRLSVPKTPLAASTRIEPRSPFQECKSVMDQFDAVLAAYKRALGPCGEATCPYAQSIAEENCRKICEHPPKDSDSISCSETPCNIVQCSYQEPRKFDIPGGCGSLKCAYTKYKLGLVDDDAALELACLPPAISGKCGHQKCPYPWPSDLLPIHWDCPEPLPKGPCRNPNCPHQPANLRNIKCPPPKPGPCGKVTCPFAMPEPCDKPNCPFRPRPCLFLEQEKLKKRQQERREVQDAGGVEVCENPECPFAQQGNPVEHDPRYEGEFESCANPACPHAQTPRKKKTRGSPNCPFADEGPNECANPQCPFAPPSPKTNFCGSPQCPHALKPKAKGDFSGNLDCPNAPNPAEVDSGSNPKCPFAAKQKKSEDSFCGNPACPYNPQQENTSDEVCDNPKCPAKKRKIEQEGICENPGCAYQNSDQCATLYDDDLDNKRPSEEKCPKVEAKCAEDAGDVCDNPECPFGNNKAGEEFICRDPLCMYAQPLASCGIPDCPYEPIPFLYCPSRKFPSNRPPPPQSSRRSSSACYREAQPGGEPECDGDEKLRKDECENRRQSFSSARRTSATLEAGASRRSSSKKTELAGLERGDAEGKKKHRKKRSAFVYSVGERYPGVKVGHKECVTPVFNVPPKMGWLWNVGTMYSQPRRGWRPGAIQKSIAQRIRAHRQAKGLGYFRPPKFRKSKGGLGDSTDEIRVHPKPTLHICKKDGAYLITMNPLKDPYSLVENENPYMDCTPMQFRITKNKNKEDGDDDSKMCTCKDDEATSSSASELDIEFTPPAGIIHPDRFKKKKNVVHTDTQYEPDDFATKKEKGGKGGKKDKKGGKSGKGKIGKK